MSGIQCIANSDITDLRSLLEDIKSNLYTWIDTKQKASEITDTSLQAIRSSIQPRIASLGTFTYSNENINNISIDSNYIKTINDIING